MSVDQQLFALGVRLKSTKEGEHTTTCPQCSAGRKKKTDPCLSVLIDDKGFTYNCHHCGWKKDGKELSKFSGSMELQRPPKQYTKPVFEVKGLSGKHLSYLSEERQIPPSVLGQYDITSIGEEIAFPLFKDGQVVNVKYRGPQKKFRQEANAEKVFFGMQNCASSGTLVIVEGEIDCLSVKAAGYDSVISVPEGAPAKLQDDTPKPEEDRKFAFVWNCRDFLKQFERIILATDNDEPGNVLAEELARRLGRGKCSRATFPEKDANGQHVKHGIVSVKQCLEAAVDYPIQGLYRVSDVFNDVFDMWMGNIPMAGKATGWKSVDKLLSISEGQLSIVTGIPGSGKSQWVDALLLNLARNYGMKFAICSFENDMKHHIFKYAHSYMGKFPSHETSKESEFWDALNFIHAHFFFIRPSEDAPTIDWIIERAKEATLRHGIEGLVIDPYNELAQDRKRGDSETEYVSEMLGKLKRFLQTYSIHGWMIAHPTKAGPDKDPNQLVGLYGISGGAHWANKADLGVTVHRAFNEDSTRSNDVTIAVTKVRQSWIGTTGQARLEYNTISSRYFDDA